MYWNDEHVESVEQLLPRFEAVARQANPPVVKVVPDKRAPYERVAQVLAAAQRSRVQVAERRAHRRYGDEPPLEPALGAHRRLGDPAEQQHAEREPGPETSIGFFVLASESRRVSLAFRDRS